MTANPREPASRAKEAETVTKSLVNRIVRIVDSNET